MKGIYRLWIIDQLSGISYIDAVVKETGKSTDGELIGGLFTAINMFSAEALSETMTAIETESYKILFHIETNLILAFLIDKEEPSLRFRGLMRVIHQTFVKKYPEVISGEFSGKVSIFDPFQEELEGLLGLKGIKFMKTFDKILERPDITLKPALLLASVRERMLERQKAVAQQLLKKYKLHK